MQRNIHLLYFIKVSKWLMLYMPIIKLYYEENNLQDHHLLILHAVYSVIIALIEIPTGYLADVIGRKLTMIIGTLAGTVGFALYSITYGLWGFLSAEILLGIGQSFISGSDTALLYDSLKDSNRHKRYIKYEGRITAIGNFSEAAAGILVSLLAFSVMRNYYYIQTGVAFVGFLASLFLIEPSFHLSKPEHKYRYVFSVIRQQIFGNKKLVFYIFFSSIIGFASLSMAWFAQMIFFKLDIQTSFFYGIAWTVLNLTLGLGSLAAYGTEKILGRQASLFFILSILGLGFILIPVFMTRWIIIILLIFYLWRGIAHPILKQYINELTKSDIRATIFSIRSMIIRMFFFISALFLAPIRQIYGLELSILTAGILILVPGSFLLILLWIKKSKSQLTSHHRQS